MKVIDIFGHINVCIQSCVLDLNEPFFVCTGPPFHMYTSMIGTCSRCFM